MARIPGVPKGEESWILRLANRYSARRLGAAVEPAQIAGHQPWLLVGAGAYDMASERLRSVPARLKTLADIKAAMMIGCPF